MILHPPQVLRYPLLAMALDDIVFSIGYEHELEEKIKERKYQAQLHDKELR